MNAVAQFSLSRRDLLLCLASLGLALVPHMLRFPASAVGFAILILWRTLGAFGLLPLPDRDHRLLWAMKQLLAVCAFAAIYIANRGQIGRDAGVMLLTVLLGLKVLELNRERDFYVVCFLGYFLTVTNFFYSQSVFMALYMLAVVVAITTNLVCFNAGGAPPVLRAHTRLAATIVAQALPIMALAFVLFPRLPGPLWGLPQDAFSAVSGLSDSMTMGRITALGLSDAIAFRVKFEGKPPPPRDLYWRGPVLTDTDGLTWRRTHVNVHTAPKIIAKGPLYHYSVLLEPTAERWLLALDAVIDVIKSAHLNSDLTLSVIDPVKRRQAYSLTSAPNYTWTEISDDERAQALQLPSHQHPRTRALAESWHTENIPPAGLVVQALEYFKQHGFVYTLLPPELNGDPVDEFLFDTRAGFCEHYAAAFVVLMRAAGVPARVVTGYQGGEFNDVSDYLVVRQLDAHAWAEVYLPAVGWVRVDPTSVVAPNRLALGSAVLARSRTPLALLNRDSAPLVAWRTLANWWDAANTQWARWVVGYSPQTQRALFNHLGFGDLDFGDMLIALTGMVTTCVIALSVAVLHTSQQRDPVQTEYHKFCRKLARRGFIRAMHEAPFAFVARVADAHPQWRAEMTDITELYSGLRYADAKFDIGLLRNKVRRFNPRAPS